MNITFHYFLVVLIAFIVCSALIYAGLIAYTTLTISWPPPPFRDQPQEWGLHAEDVQIGEGTAWYFRNPQSRRLVIFAHGHNRSRHWTLPIVHAISPFANVLAIDLPAHGSMWPGLCTFGVRESVYVNEAIAWAEQNGFDHVLVAGHSMGGSTSLLALTQQDHPIVDGVATIGSYGSIEAVYRGIAETAHLPQSIVTSVLDTSSNVAHYDYRNASPIHHIPELKIPYLVIHGTGDHLVPRQEAERLAEASGGATSLIWYHGGHDEPRNPEIAKALIRFITVLDQGVSEPTFH